MSFPTARFFHNINPADVQNVVFTLYDARLVGNVGSPNPNAIIETVSKATTPGRFVIGTTGISVMIYSSTLDAYETTYSAGARNVFRGELYGFADLTVGGEETNDITRLPAGTVSASSQVNPAPFLEPDVYWDGYFYSTSVYPVACKATVGSATLS